MTTYTIAFDDMLLWATVPDGADIDAAVDREVDQVNVELDRDTLTVESGLILTNDDPLENDEILWSGSSYGWLMDENGITYKHAVRRA